MRWDASEGNRGGETTAWEALLDMEKYEYDVEEMYQGAVIFVVDFANSFGKVQQTFCLGVCNALWLPADNYFGNFCVGIVSILEGYSSRVPWQIRCILSQPFFWARSGQFLSKES